MKQLNDALLEEVKNNKEAILILEGKGNEYIEAIKILEEKIENLGRETSSKANGALETQTSLDPGETKLQLPCRICIYGWDAPGGTSLYKDVHICPQNLFSLHFPLNLLLHYIQWYLFCFFNHGPLI